MEPASSDCTWVEQKPATRADAGAKDATRLNHTINKWLETDGGSADILAREGCLMSDVEKIEGRINELAPEELAAFREWFI
jgi:hypothetical protein